MDTECEVYDDVNGEMNNKLINDCAVDYHYFSKLFRIVKPMLTKDQIKQHKLSLLTMKLNCKLLHDGVDPNSLISARDEMFEHLTTHEVAKYVKSFKVLKNKDINKSVRDRLASTNDGWVAFK